MRASIEKEAELLELLEEAKNEAADADPKKKGKGARTPQEIQDELDQLLSFEKSGWILMDFPRNLNQAKLLENAFTGFQATTDLPKPLNQQNLEVWSKFTDPDNSAAASQPGLIEPQPSLFDRIFVMDAPKEECARRGTGRKIDPQTGTIYHLEDSPPPEGDAKLLERLQDFWGDYANQEDMMQKIELNHVHYNDNEASLNAFTAGFGQLDKVEGKGLEAQVLIKSDAGRAVDEVSEQVRAQLN